MILYPTAYAVSHILMKLTKRFVTLRIPFEMTDFPIWTNNWR
jgi:hypothetical protein